MVFIRNLVYGRLVDPLNTATWGERSVDHAVPRMRDMFQIISVQLVLISFTSIKIQFSYRIQT